MIVELLKLHACAATLLEAAGETPKNAAVVADALVKCDARGITTHGTHLLNPIYGRVRENQLQLPTKAFVAKEVGATAIVDGADGLGPVAAALAAALAAEKAEKHGSSTVLIRNTNNVGALAVYTDQIAGRGMIALMCCNASPAMAPWGGMERFIGTQPFAFSIYTGCDVPFGADMATSIVARGKIRKAARYGQSIPGSWALDSEGNATTDPNEALKGTVLPIGGPKGSAIGLAIDIVAGMLSGSHYAPNVKPIHTPSGKAGVGGYLQALNIAHFYDLEQFKSEMAEYIHSIKQLRKAAGFDEILLPGELEHRKERRSLQEGIELEEKAVGALNGLLTEIGSPMRLP